MAVSSNEFMKQKYDRFFNIFLDADGNKIVEWDDFHLLAEKMKTLRGEKSKEYMMVSDAMKWIFVGLIQGVKGLPAYHQVDYKDQITLAEWETMCSKFDPKHLQVWQWEYLKYMFFHIDTSGDNAIDADEYTEVMGMYGMTKDAAKTAFEKICVDDAGKKKENINISDFTRLWIEYFTCPDKSKAGSFLFGPW